MATDGRYNFRSCVPDGRIVVAQNDPSKLQSRTWQFIVNEPPSAVAYLDNGPVSDGRHIVRGYDGILLDGNGKVLASVNKWSCELTFQNDKWMPPGQKHTEAVPISFECSLSLEEAVIRDADLLQSVLDSVQPSDNNTAVPDVSLNFQGWIRTRG